MNEKDLDKLLSLEDEMENDKMIKEEEAYRDKDISFTKRLKKSMEKQINKRVFKGIALTVLGTVLALFLISVAFDAMYYNPEESTPYVKDDGQGESYVYSDFHFLMDIYTGLNYPGKKYYQVEGMGESFGFGSYKMYAKILDHYEPLVVDGHYNTIFEINRNNLSMEFLSEEANLYIDLWEFYNDSKTDEYNTYMKEIRDIDESMLGEIEKLPESAAIYASISFKHCLSLDDVLAFGKKYPESDFSWIAMDSDVQYMVGAFDGIRLSGAIGYPLTEETKEKYPNLTLTWLTNETTAEDLKQCYLSRLKIMYDNPEFLYLVDGERSMHARTKQEQIKDRIAEIDEKGLWSIGVYGRITKQDFIQMAENDEITYAAIKDVKLSVLSK